MKRYLVIIAGLMMFLTSYAQNFKRPESYNYQRGLEAMQEEKTEEAIDYFNKDLQENPKNGYALSWIAHLRLLQEDFGRALTASDHALKFLPKKDAEYVIFAYTTRAITYLNLQDTVKAINDYTAAIKASPETESLYEKRAQVYYELGKYDLADADYRKMIDLKPGEVMGYMGLGRNAMEQKKYDEAIKQFNYVTKLSSDYSSGYSFRADVLLEQKKWAEATDDLITAMKYGWDRKAVYLANNLEEPAFTMMMSKLKIQAAKSQNEASWPYLAGMMYEGKKNYNKAIENYQEANKRNASPLIFQRISYCYYEDGNYDEALAQINLALNMDSTNLDNMAHRANIFYEMGDTKKAISEWDHVLAIQPEYAFGYYRRGWYKELSGDLEGAIEDLSMAIVLQPDFSYAIFNRGDVYSQQGKKELAEADYRKVIELENTPEKYDCVHYAYQSLGMNDKAIEAMDSIIARDKDRAGNYYDAACLYARMGNKQKALEYLEKSLELGYRRFAHIEKDQDMDAIRDMDEFKALISKYKQQEKKDKASVGYGTFNVQGSDNASVSEIPFTREDGVCKVKCKINGLPLHFIFDTGASDVSISMVEATFMMKNGYLTEKDVVGSQHFMDANGNVTVGTIINLKDVDFGGQSLTNVRASVVRNQKAPLLLGQSVLGRLGKIEIDNSRNVIKLTRTTSY